MATNYPSSKQTFTDPSGTSLLTSPDHAGLHTDVNDTLEAIQDAVGTTAGTNVLLDFSAGDFPARINGSDVLQQSLQGTINNSVIGTPAITGGTVDNAVMGTPAVTGGTIDSAVMGTPAITGGTLTAPNITDARYTRNNFTDGGTITLDWSTGNWQHGTLGGNRTVAMSNGQEGGKYILQVHQDGTGSRTLTYGTEVLWPAGGTTTLSTGSADVDFIAFLCDGTNYYAVGESLDLS